MPATTRPAANARLHQLFAEEWAYQMEQSPEAATFYGQPGHDDRWGDLAPEAVDARLAHARDLLGTLSTFADEELDEVDRVSRDLLARDAQMFVEGAPFHDEWQALNQLEGVQQDPAMLIEAQPATTVEEQRRIV